MEGPKTKEKDGGSFVEHGAKTKEKHAGSSLVDGGKTEKLKYKKWKSVACIRFF